ncbi:3-methyladenine DNA glycosylase [Escherichia coli]|uniref:3-methyladenine DNA glycosylase n=1 Tax=Escherichia coli TaxID=562 RepID=A0A377BPI4_ECOLX|nr:3-methyladenine DNA glycosylase [Escherichia coli]
MVWKRSLTIIMPVGLAVGEYRGVVTAIPDIARHTLHINLSAGLEPVAAECLAKMSRLFDLQCNRRLLTVRWAS